jgi:hypothetical protein
MGKVSKIFSAPKAPKLPPPPEPLEDPNASADDRAAEEADRLRKGKVKTILTSGQGLDDTSDEEPRKRKTVLGG